MTRINTVFPLLDEHLRAARKEYPRIANKVIELVNNDNLDRLLTAPEAYTVQTKLNPHGGKGHVMFFCDKLKFVHDQYQLIREECARRGFVGGEFKNADLWPRDVPLVGTFSNGKVIDFWKDYTPTSEAIDMCKTRMIERIPEKPHFESKLISKPAAIVLISDGKLWDIDNLFSCL